MAATTAFFIGDEESGSAKKRRQNSYREDLELQMRERSAAKRREKIQQMSVDASGFLDPEKHVSRIRPLGGEGFFTNRSDRNTKVRPYHTLFNYGQMTNREPLAGSHEEIVVSPRTIPMGPSVSAPNQGMVLSRLNLDTTAGLHHHPVTEATAGTGNPVHHAYNYYATRDIDRPGAYGSIIQPLVVPYVDNRPIIMPNNYQRPASENHYRYYRHQPDTDFKDLKNMLGISHMENEKLKAQLARDHDDFQRKMRKELEDERRRLMDQEAESRRRVEDMRRDMDEKRREFERQRLLALRAREDQKSMPKTAPVVIRPSSTTLLNDMEDTKRRLIDERKRIEALLRAQRHQPDYTEVKIIRRPPPPPTPKDGDKANPHLVEEFNTLKHKDARTRQEFIQRYPEIPETNKTLEQQQRALLLHQQQSMGDYKQYPAVRRVHYIDGLRRPDWMDKTPTPFPHRLRERDRLYATVSLDGDLDRMMRRVEQREYALNTYRSEHDGYDHLKLSSRRPASADTLTDDTWLNTAAAAAV